MRLRKPSATRRLPFLSARASRFPRNYCTKIERKREIGRKSEGNVKDIENGTTTKRARTDLPREACPIARFRFSFCLKLFTLPSYTHKAEHVMLEKNTIKTATSAQP